MICCSTEIVLSLCTRDSPNENAEVLF